MTEPAPRHLKSESLFRLDNRTVIISGGNGAVGKTISQAILDYGADVAILDRSIPAIERLTDVSFSVQENGPRKYWLEVNVQDEASIKSALDRLRPRLRHPIQGFVSCAAISGESDACDYPIDVFRRIIDTNITGTFLMARCVAYEMHLAGVSGSMVLFASMSGHVSNRGINTAAYNASKSAVHQLARSLAAEWGHPQNTFAGSTVSETNPNPSTEPRKVYPPIRVNTISPGHINTPLSQAARDRGLTEEWAKQNMLGRISEPEEFRAPVVFLLSEGSSYMTGADLRIDGGHCAW